MYYIASENGILRKILIRYAYGSRTAYKNRNIEIKLIRFTSITVSHLYCYSCAWSLYKFC